MELRVYVLLVDLYSDSMFYLLTFTAAAPTPAAAWQAGPALTAELPTTAPALLAETAEPALIPEVVSLVNFRSCVFLTFA